MVRKEGARLCGASGIRSASTGRCQMMLPAILVTLIQYLLTVPILMCGLTAQSARLSFLFARAQDNSPRRMEHGRQKFKVEMPSMPTDLFLHGRKKMLQSNSILCRGNG